MQITGDTFSVIVKPNSSKSEIKGYDTTKNAYRVNIKARPENNKANIELIRFLSKILKKKVKILQGHKTKAKKISII
ncbi:MAG: DUF167 domain-containing protein [Nanoarchaeota archaeon]